MVSLTKFPPPLYTMEVAKIVKLASESVEYVAFSTSAWDVQAWAEVRAAFAQVLKLAAQEMEYALPKN